MKRYFFNFIDKLNINRSFFKKKVVKDFLAVLFSNLALRPIQFLKSFIVAKYLGPTDYGLLKTIDLVQMLNKYGTLGFNTTASREVGNLLGKNDKAKAYIVKNTAYSAEIILSILLFILGLTSSLLVESKNIVILIVLASFGLLFSKFRGVLATEAVIQKKFILTSKITFYTVSIASLVVIITVPFLKIYAVMLTNILIGVFAIIFYLRFMSFNFKFKLQKKSFKKILSISIPLTIGTLALGSFQYAERILIIKYLGMNSLGLYTFAAMITGQFTVIFKSSIKVRIQDVFEGIGKGNYNRIHKLVIKETMLIVLGSILLIPLVCLAVDVFIPLFLPKWSGAISISKIFIFSLPFEIMLSYISVVLISSLVDKQRILPLYRFISTGILISSVIYLHYYGFLTLKNFVILRIVSSFFYVIPVVYLYRKYFYLKHIKRVL